MEITKNFLTPNPMSRPQTQLKKVTKIAVHYVANPGVPAINNRNYFENLKNQKIIFASSHYIIGLQGEIIQCIPESEIAYCTNDANSYSISIENCHPDVTGKFNDKTYASLIELCADICRRYKLDPRTDMIRHYDVTGKHCPLYYVKNPAEWAILKARVYDAVMSQKTTLPPAGCVNLSVNNKVVTIKAVNTNGRWEAAVRDVLEAQGYKVEWREETKTIKAT